MSRWGITAIVGAGILIGHCAQAQDFSQFNLKNCADVKFDESDPKSIALGAKWCGGPDATLTISQNQNITHFGKGVCHKYVGTYGAIHQNELQRLAILDVRKGDYVDAVVKIAACQCHNPPAVDMAYAQAKELVCWLSTQNH